MLISMESLLQESLDNYLLGPGGAITVMMGSFHHVISEQIESLLFQNFQVINEFGEHLSAFRKEDFGRSSVVETLLSLFDDLLKKVPSILDKFMPICCIIVEFPIIV